MGTYHKNCLKFASHPKARAHSWDSVPALDFVLLPQLIFIPKVIFSITCEILAIGCHIWNNYGNYLLQSDDMLCQHSQRGRVSRICRKHPPLIKDRDWCRPGHVIFVSFPSSFPFTRLRPSASRLARPFGPRGSRRRTTENRSAHRIVCRRYTKIKQSGDRTRNRKQICLLTGGPSL